MGPLVSVIIAAYNAEKYISQVIRSTLNQTYGNLECIVVDDASRDNTVEIVRSINDKRIRLICNSKNLKAGATRNIAIDNSRGEYIAVTDADDLNMPTRIQTQMEYLENHPQVDAVGSNYYVFEKNGHILGGVYDPHSAHEDLIKKIYYVSPISHPTMMARAAWFQRFKYRPEYFRCQDRELFLRSYRYSTFANIPGFLYAYRLDESHNLKKPFMASYYVNLMLWRHWREYGVPLPWVLGFPFISAGRLLYHSLAIAFKKGMLWSHIKSLPRNDDFIRAQEWIWACLGKKK